MSSDITLREVVPSDLAIFYVQRTDPGAAWMAAFTEEGHLDREASIARSTEIFSQPTVIARTILCDGEVAGDLVSYIMEDQREVGYWLGRAYWGGVSPRRRCACFWTSSPRARSLPTPPKTTSARFEYWRSVGSP